MATRTGLAVKTMADVINQMPELYSQLVPGTDEHSQLEQLAAAQARREFSSEAPQLVNFAPFGEIIFPYLEMGAVTSLNLFHIDELILFAFYWANRRRYKQVADIGANIGLHSMLLNRAGYEVRAYEPDPEHLNRISKNFELNNITRVVIVEAAVAAKAGHHEFVQVWGNTTGSHLAGAKVAPYGDLSRIEVKTVAGKEVMNWADLVKLDVEGQEQEIILATTRADWDSCDMLLEIGGEDNAAKIIEHLDMLGVNLFTQKIGWRRAERVEDVPVSYHEGLAFASQKSAMPWG